MKRELDSEMDSLLRGSGPALGGAGGARPAGPHLDADELSAFAENSLPPAARARYTAHLADCAGCRRLVVGVASASGVEVGRAARAEAVAAKKSAPSWRAGLAWLLAPRFLRYAVPVLAVAILAALALVVLRRGRGADQVAFSPPAEPAQRVSVTNNTAGETGASQPGGEPLSTTGGTSGSTTGTTATNTSAAAARPKESQPSEADEPSRVATEGVRDDRAEGRAGATASNLAPPPAFIQPGAGSAAAPPAPAVAEASAPAPRSEAKPVVKAEDEQPAAAGARQQQEVARVQSAEENRAARSGGTAATTAKRRVATPGVLDELPARRERKDGGTARSADAATESRRVAGHEFRREGGAWVDVNYRPPMGASEVRRGSERFRSLAADFPEVERAAAQLPGTVIIVVRGRAYKIR